MLSHLLCPLRTGKSNKFRQGIRIGEEDLNLHIYLCTLFDDDDDDDAEFLVADRWTQVEMSLVLV